MRRKSWMRGFMWPPSSSKSSFSITYSTSTFSASWRASTQASQVSILPFSPLSLQDYLKLWETTTQARCGKLRTRWQSRQAQDIASMNHTRYKNLWTTDTRNKKDRRRLNNLHVEKGCGRANGLTDEHRLLVFRIL
jgi:hypothetical protein